MLVGVLALQGNFDAHIKRLQELGAQTKLVKRAQDLDQIQAVVLPGGESTTMLKLMDENLWKGLQQKISAGLPTLATCAGLILLAKGVGHPAQASLALLDVDVERNAYGRQIDSFIDKEALWTNEGAEEFNLQLNGNAHKNPPIEAVFIRAPKISRVGSEVKVLLKSRNEPVLVKAKNIMAATFHPEMSEDARIVHQRFLDLCTRA